MTTDTTAGRPAPGLTDESEQIRAHGRVVKKHGDWTTARHFDVRASRGVVALDLVLPRIEAGDIEVELDIDHAVLKLLVPDGAIIDHDELRRVGRGRVKDSTGTSAPHGRRITLLGEMRSSEVRIQRGGVALLSLMLSRRGLRAVRQAHRDGRLGEPARGAVDPRA
jgi:hypothetical protein